MVANGRGVTVPHAAGAADNEPFTPQVEAEGIPGTGLWASTWALLLSISVLVFMFWGGPLWTAPRTASHVGRFVVSYLVVVPLAVALLLARKRLSWVRVLTATGTVWASKLVVTSALYLAFAHGTAREFAAVAPPSPSRALENTGYQPARAGFASGEIRGSVDWAGDGEAIVYLEAPPPGKRPAPPAEVRLAVEHGQYIQPLLLVAAGDELSIRNGERTLHTVHVGQATPGGGTDASSNRGIANHPLASLGTTSLALPGPGVFTLRCDLHPEEQATLVALDHPYGVPVGEGGAFTLSEVPAGDLVVVAVGRQRRVRGAVRVDGGKITHVTVEDTRIQITSGP